MFTYATGRDILWGRGGITQPYINLGSRRSIVAE